MGLSENVQDNRTRLIETCMEHNLKILNTQYRKRTEKTVTYRTPGTTKADEIKRPTASLSLFFLKKLSILFLGLLLKPKIIIKILFFIKA